MQLFDAALMEGLKDDNFGIIEGEALTCEDEDLKEYENDNLDSLEPSIKNMNHTVERDDYDDDDAYDLLLSAELLLPN